MIAVSSAAPYLCGMVELDGSPGARRARRGRPPRLGIALIGVLGLVVGGIVTLEARIGAVPAAPVSAADATDPLSPSHRPFQAIAEVPTLTPPQFEMAGIGPDRNVVASGTGEPNASIGIRDGATELGRVRADASGRWNFTGVGALAPGGHEIALVERDAAAPADRPETVGAEPMMLVVAADEPLPLATLTEFGPAPPLPVVPTLPLPLLADLPTPAPLPTLAAGARLASLPLRRPTAAAIPSGRVLTPLAVSRRARGRVPLRLETASYNVLGTPRLSGRASDGAPLVVIVDGRRAGRANANGSGRWSVALGQRLKAGPHHVRVEEIAASGQILAAVERPLIRD